MWLKVGEVKIHDKRMTRRSTGSADVLVRVLRCGILAAHECDPLADEKVRAPMKGFPPSVLMPVGSHPLLIALGNSVSKVLGLTASQARAIKSPEALRPQPPRLCQFFTKLIQLA